MDESYSLGVGSTKEFGVILWDGRSPFFVVVVLFCFSNSGVPPNEGFQSRALGRGDWTTRNLVKIGAEGQLDLCFRARARHVPPEDLKQYLMHLKSERGSDVGSAWIFCS